MPLVFAANISTMFCEWGFLDRIEAAGDAGFDAVECQFPYDFTPEHLVGRLRRHGLSMVLLNAPPGRLAEGDLGLAAVEGREDEFRSSIREAIRYAEALGTPRIHILAGQGATSLSRFAERLAWAVRALAASGLTALIEPLNPIDRPDYALTRYEDAVGLIQTIGAPNLKLQLDLYHWRRMGGRSCEALERLLPHTGHVQIAAARDRGEPEADDLAFLACVAAAGYSGTIGCEYVPREHTLDGLGWLQSTGRRLDHVAP